jgi:UDP-glucose 4-epimerase
VKIDPSARPTVLVTGGAGFIGAYTVRLLVEQGARVRVLDNMYRADLAVLAEQRATDGVEVVEGDVRYRPSVERALDGVAGVVHLAALAINKSVAEPEESIDVNLVGSQNVFSAAAAAGVDRLVFASSASVYGEPTRLPMAEDDPLNPKTPYCTSKLASEHLLRFYEERAGLDWTALRFFNVYGPGQRTDAYYTTVVLVFVERLLRGEAPVIDGAGDQTMDFVHVRDVARSLVLALTSEQSRQVVNIGTGVQTSIAELARMLIDVVGADAEPEFRPRDVMVSRRAADISRAAEMLGWVPEVGVKEGLAEIVAGIVDVR